MNARNGQLRCGECDAVFNHVSSLIRHGHIHSGAFRCVRDGCEKAFSEHKHLSKHLNRHSSTNLRVRIVPFNIRAKVEVKDEPSDVGGGSSQQSVRQWKRVKKEEDEDEVKVKIEQKDEHDQTGDGDRDNGHTVRGFNCKKEEDDETYCGCDDCDTELGRHKAKIKSQDKVTVEDDPQMDHSASFNAQPSTSTYCPDFNQPQSAGYEPENDPVLLAQVKREIKEEENELALQNLMHNNTTQTKQDDGQMSNQSIDDDHQSNGQVNSATQQDLDHEIEEDGQMMERFDETTNQLELIPIPNQTHNRDTSLISSNEQLNLNLTNSKDEEEEDQVNHDTQQLGDETNNGEMMEIEEEIEDEDRDENDDEDTEIDDNEGDDEFRSMKNTRIEKTLPHPNGQTVRIVRQSALRSKRKLTDEMDYQEDEEDDGSDVEITFPSVKRSRPSTLSSTKQEQIITHTLQCSQCDLMFVQSKLLTKHLWDVHSIRRYSCPLKNCGESFDYKHLVGLHLTQSHQSTTQWPCAKCDRHFTTYNILSTHNILNHQFGQFQCSFPACTFTGECKKKVISHYTQHHKQSFACVHPECPFRAPNEAKLRQHQRTHLGIKPYRCKWSQCDFAAAQLVNTINHIRRKHFKGSPSSNVQLVDDYVEVNETLLDNPDGINDDWSVDNTKQNSQIITRTLQCPRCGLTFAKEKFNRHLKEEHSIGPFRCVVKDCDQSFENRHSLSHHLAQSHQSTTQWHCGNCDRHFTSYQVLSNHNIKHHQFGHFQCSIPDCTFTEEYRIKVYGHYRQHMKTLSQD